MKTVVHLLSGDEAEQETALAIARNLLDDETDRIDEVAIVVQADGMAAVKADGENADQVRTLLEDDVAFRACSNTLEMLDLEESDLVDGIETVPEGAVEVTRLQSEEGYAYLRP
ncbi:DsrE family protein [Halopiger xanaduensis]|uniref:Uncharacterized protein n=1 Tax=Halopiger xanaduensis (strain DSM 18323 / JCM 14033 / SH-6) TaxID=797210 RepID=F8D5G6_HALXS|nr:DsrE family protein [Halopiger xanaduensis]AEH38802.1 hypothetical protein Halxa_4200 [Halopiger xanaduensis SH-6]